MFQESYRESPNNIPLNCDANFLFFPDLQSTAISLDYRVTNLENNRGGNNTDLEARVTELEETTDDQELRIATNQENIEGTVQLYGQYFGKPVFSSAEEILVKFLTWKCELIKIFLAFLAHKTCGSIVEKCWLHLPRQKSCFLVFFSFSALKADYLELDTRVTDLKENNGSTSNG